MRSVGVFVFVYCLVVWTACARAAQAQGEPASEETGAALYVLQVGDEIEIKVFGIPELGDTIQIGPDGRISVLLLDSVEAAGLTTTELDEYLTTRYTEFYRDPRVTVVVRNFAQLNVCVGGAVGEPGILPLAGELTALGAVMRAGGFLDSATMSSVILIRKMANDTPLIVRVNLKDAINKGEGDIQLQPSDVVFVPKKFIAQANLFVRQYIRDLLPIATTANFTYILGATAIVP